MKSAGLESLAYMPPTRAAAISTTCGRACRIQRSSCSADLRSTSALGALTTRHFSRDRRRTRAEPTRPRCPATQTRLPARSKGTGLRIVVAHPTQDGAIGLDHFRHQLLEADLVLPPELGARLRRIAQKQIDLGRPVVFRIDHDQRLAGAAAVAALIDAAPLPDDRPLDAAEGKSRRLS